ncbi:MAG TPA: hypothetical protein VFH12_00475, partial [Pseudoxanthomonas sp.]|nr:hypothetical protein [Pseudoxanthomonas sp.]
PILYVAITLVRLSLLIVFLARLKPGDGPFLQGQSSLQLGSIFLTSSMRKLAARLGQQLAEQLPGFPISLQYAN